MPEVRVFRKIAFRRDVVWRRLSNIEQYERHMTPVLAAKIVAQTGNVFTTEWKILLRGHELRWRQREEHIEGRGEISFEQTDGDLEYFHGRWSLAPAPGGATKVSFAVDFDIGIPMLNKTLNPIAKAALEENSLLMLMGLETDDW